MAAPPCGGDWPDFAVQATTWREGLRLWTAVPRIHRTASGRASARTSPTPGAAA